MNTSIGLRTRTNVRTSLQAARAAVHAIAPASPELAARIALEVFVRPRRHATPRREAEALATARASRVPFGDGSLPVWTWGDERAPAVLLVHGWEGRGSQMSPFVPALLAHGFRAVAFDGPGHGRARSQRSSAVHMALAIERIAQHEGRPLAGLIAHSVGGAATALAQKLSHGTLEIGRCVLVAPPVSAKRFFDWFCLALDLDGAMREAVANRIERELGVPLATVDVRAATPYLHAPMLLLHDEADREVPFEDARTFVRAWPGAQLVVTSGLGHHRILRDPDVVTAAAAFIAGKTDVATGLPFGSIERDLYDRERRWTRSVA